MIIIIIGMLIFTLIESDLTDYDLTSMSVNLLISSFVVEVFVVHYCLSLMTINLSDEQIID